MKIISNRISFIDKGKFTTVIILPEKNALINALMGAWLGIWICIGVTCITCLFILSLSQQEKIILYIFISFWAYYSFSVGRTFIWRMVGKELIRMDELGIHVKKSIFNYGKSIPFYYDHLNAFRIEIAEKKSLQAVWESSPWVKGSDSIVFDYKAKTFGLGRKINKEESIAILNLIKKRKAKFKYQSKTVN